MTRTHFFVFLIIVCFSLSLFADIVVLKNGRKIEGTILSQIGDFIVVKDDFNIEYKIQKTDVQTIQIATKVQTVQQNKVQVIPTVTVNELEDNNSFSKANLIGFNAQGIGGVDARIFPNGDRDYFSVKVDKAGEYSFTATAAKPGSRLGIRIINADARLVKNWTWAEAGVDSVTTGIDINWDYIGKNLYLEVAQYGDNKVSDYRVDVAYYDIRDIWESNNRFREAKMIKMNTSTESYIFPNGDRDYFRLMIPDQGRLSLKLSCVDPNIRLGMRLLTDENTLLRNWVWAEDAGEISELIQDFNLSGEIIIEVAHYGDNRRSFTPYLLENLFVIIPDSHEPNGRFRNAADIKINVDNTGYLFAKGDRDYFRFTLPQPGLVKVSITTNDPLTRLQFRVLTDEDTLYRNWIVADENAKEVELEMEMFAGVYYLELAEYGDNYASMQPYKLNVTLLPSMDNFEANNSFSEAKTLFLNTPYTAEIFPKGDRDYFKFDINRPGELIITLKPGTVHRLGLRILNANNGVYENWTYASDFSKELTVKEEIKTAGVYYIEVMDYGDSRGSIIPYSIIATIK